ncbi:MAG TPA: daunorubicin/doxorubicin resistance ABC transporter ATP-binding protein DrrA, partial [Nocardioides sp.]|nr:daunorubicin/doxorubicin resistance ABC transporter ATP-binding protein DrrA [Nocardioides sp.]
GVARGETQETGDTGKSFAASVDGGQQALLQVLQGFADEQIEVVDVGLRRPTLDDVFMALTGHAAEVEADAESAQTDKTQEVPA